MRKLLLYIVAKKGKLWQTLLRKWKGGQKAHFQIGLFFKAVGLALK